MKPKSRSQVKYGALISYILIIGNALFGLLVTPYVLRMLGSSPYGVYKTIGSFSNAIIILDFGIGGTLQRYISKFRANLQDNDIGSFASMMVFEASILIVAIALLELGLFFLLDDLYSVTFSVSELLLAKNLYIVLSINVLLVIVENFLNGIITGYNNFILGNGTKLLKLIIRILLIFVVLPISKTPMVLVSINLILTVLSIVIQLWYICRNLHIVLNFDNKFWDKGVFRESITYTTLIFLTAIAAQVNGNLDNVIIGVFCGPKQVTVYSFALVIFGMFEQLSTAMSGVVLPTVSKIVAQENWKARAQAYVVKIGRIQYMLLGAAVVGFAVLGKEFISLWLGDDFGDVYSVVLILMIPSLFELCVNVCLAVLRAQNKLGFRTTVLVLSTILNFIISVAGIRYIGYFSAALGTAASFILGSLIIMNTYYYKTLGFDMLSVYRDILKGTWICQILAGMGIAFSSRFLNGTWLAFLANVLLFAGIYVASLLLFGISDEERLMIKKVLRVKYV